MSDPIVTLNQYSLLKRLRAMDDQAEFAAADLIEELLELLKDVATVASRITTPVCDDGGGFHHCCGGNRSGCKPGCAVREMRTLVRDDLRDFVRPQGAQP